MLSVSFSWLKTARNRIGSGIKDLLSIITIYHFSQYTDNNYYTQGNVYRCDCLHCIEKH